MSWDALVEIIKDIISSEQMDMPAEEDVNIQQEIAMASFSSEDALFGSL